MCEMGTTWQGGGLMGSILAVPLIEGFNMTVAKVVIIALITFVTFLVTGIAFSTIMIGIHDWFCDMIAKNKEEMENRHNEQLAEVEEMPRVSQKKNKRNSKFQQIMEQTGVVEEGEQLNFCLDDEPVEDEQEIEERRN